MELVKVADKTYYFVENGEKKTGFIKIDEKTYYLKDGVLTPNIVVIDGKKFFIDNEGNRSVVWKKIEKVLTKVLTKYQKITILAIGIIFSLIFFE